MSLLAVTMFRVGRSTKLAPCVNQFHTSVAMHLDQKWREKKGLVKNPNHYGPLVTKSDYSFEDKRPVAYGSRQLNRIKQHQEYVKKIVQLVGEVDHAVERHARIVKEKEAQRQEILVNKLKPKGTELIVSK